MRVFWEVGRGWGGRGGWLGISGSAAVGLLGGRRLSRVLLLLRRVPTVKWWWV